MSNLFAPITLGDKLKLSHRVVHAPLTRFRANAAHVHGPLATEYYSQRASTPGTLIIAEATIISPQAGGAAHAPGIWTQDQINGWRKVVDAVHKKGSYIVLQLWALGRAAKPEQLEKEGIRDGYVSSSAMPMAEGGPVPRPLTTKEIWQYVEDFAQAAKNGIAAGFDAVEIHAANGYMIDQFTQDITNKRTDEWGGGIENRSRFALEITKAVVTSVGANRVGIRLSPWSSYQGMKMQNPVPQFTHLIHELKELKLAYIHLVESRVDGAADVEAFEKINFALQIWGRTSPVLLAGGYQPDSAKRTGSEHPDNDVLVVFGRLFISNPDLPFRLKEGLPLTEYNLDTFYTPEIPVGYIDYPFSKEWEAQSRY